MIKLTDLLNEQESFTATSKKSGETAVFKTKDARDAAVKSGTHAKIKDSDDGDSKKDTPKVNIFDEPKKDEPTKDSSKERAGNPKINKSVREKAKDLGITPQKLGKEEYESRMSKAAVEALTDSNFHSEARKLISILEDKPEWDSNPMNDPDKPKDVFSKEYDEWRKNTVFSSELYDSAEGTDEIAHLATNQSGWEGETSIDAIAFDLKMNGSKELAAKIQSIFEGNSISKGSESISISKLVNENYKGSFSDFKYEFGMALDNIGISPKAIKNISKKGKGYEVRLSSYMSQESAWKKIGEKIGADLIDFKKGTINIGLYESTKVGQLIKEGTRSQVGVIGRNGKIVSAYVHYDGYPDNMKPGLKHHMKNEKDVLKLIKMGGARGIFNDKDIEYYKSGQPMKGDFKDVESYIKDADMKNGAEYVYLYNVKDKKWYYADTYKDTELKKLF